MPSHEVAERRSLALHRAVAERLRVDPAILTRARARVGDWIRTRAVHPRYAEAWSDLLARPVEEICAAITRDDEDARALRQTTPFAGALDPRARWAIWREAGRAP